MRIKKLSVAVVVILFVRNEQLLLGKPESSNVSVSGFEYD